jgi:hypothetical protein
MGLSMTPYKSTIPARGKTIGSFYMRNGGYVSVSQSPPHISTMTMHFTSRRRPTVVSRNPRAAGMGWTGRPGFSPAELDQKNNGALSARRLQLAGSPAATVVVVEICGGESRAMKRIVSEDWSSIKFVNTEFFGCCSSFFKTKNSKQCRQKKPGPVGRRVQIYRPDVLG